jgi:hypothetical protein
MKKVSIPEWIGKHYADGVGKPTEATVRRWIKAGRIAPSPSREGGRYYIMEGARVMWR